MEYKVLYRKYRPQNFDSVVDQVSVVRLLRNAISDDKISHAYIFTGPRGTGKTSIAKIFAKAINCPNSKDGNPCNNCDFCNKMSENPDIIEIDAASNNGVDDIRELIDNVRLAPSISKYKVYIIDEFHMLSVSAFNALLLTLEEPPQNVVFILATTDIQSVPITILSRCQRFDFKPISINSIIDRLKFVCKEEKIKITDDALNEIAIMSSGGMRDALSILDQISTSDKKIEVDDIVNYFGSISDKKVSEFVNFFINGNVESIINYLSEFKKDGIDYRILVNKLINKFKNILVDIRLDKEDFNVDYNDIYNLIFELNNSISNVKNNTDPYVFIEIVLLKFIKKSNSYTQEKVENIVIDKQLKTEESQVELVENTEENSIESSSEDHKLVLNEDNKDNNNYFPAGNINIDVRINNCFVNAKKEYLSTIKDKWNDFIIYESNANKKLMSFIMDTDIVVASDCYAILTNISKSSVEMINEHIKTLELDFKGFYGLNYKLVCLSPKIWDEQKEKYIFNIKNKVKYSIIDEVESNSDELSNPIDNDSDELEKLAAEIFEDNVEIK